MIVNQTPAGVAIDSEKRLLYVATQYNPHQLSAYSTINIFNLSNGNLITIWSDSIYKPWYDDISIDSHGDIIAVVPYSGSYPPSLWKVSAINGEIMEIIGMNYLHYATSVAVDRYHNDHIYDKIWVFDYDYDASRLLCFNSSSLAVIQTINYDCYIAIGLAMDAMHQLYAGVYGQPDRDHYIALINPTTSNVTRVWTNSTKTELIQWIHGVVVNDAGTILAVVGGGPDYTAIYNANTHTAITDTE